MTRILNDKENRLYESFKNKLDLQPVSAKAFTVIKGATQFSIQEPVIYKIANSDALLVFGEFSAGMDLNRLREEFMRYSAENNNISNNEENGINEETNKVVSEVNNEDAKVSEVKEEVAEVKDDEDDKDVEIEVDMSKIIEEDVEILTDKYMISGKRAIRYLAENKYDFILALSKAEEDKSVKK